MVGLVPTTASFIAATFPAAVALVESARALVDGNVKSAVPLLLFMLLLFGGASGLWVLWFFLIRSWQRRVIAPHRRSLLFGATLGIAANVFWVSFGPAAPDLFTAYIFWAPLLIGIPNLLYFLSQRGAAQPGAAGDAGQRA
jgi:hypothetical protein